jgi:hypothetical protein
MKDYFKLNIFNWAPLSLYDFNVTGW